MYNGNGLICSPIFIQSQYLFENRQNWLSFLKLQVGIVEWLYLVDLYLKIQVLVYNNPVYLLKTKFRKFMVLGMLFGLVSFVCASYVQRSNCNYFDSVTINIFEIILFQKDPLTMLDEQIRIIKIYGLIYGSLYLVLSLMLTFIFVVLLRSLSARIPHLNNLAIER